MHLKRKVLHMIRNTTAYLRLLLLPLRLLEKLLGTKLQDGRQLLLVERSRAEEHKTHWSQTE